MSKVMHNDELIIQEIEEEREESLLEKFGDYDEFKQVLTGRASFRYLVEDYYRLGEGTLVMNPETKLKRDKFRGERDSKKPEDLIKIISEATHFVLEDEKLDYDLVREDYYNYHGPDPENNKKFCRTILGGAYGILGSFAYFGSYDEPVVFFGTLISGLASLMGTFAYLATDFTQPLERNGGYGSYKNLLSAADMLDEEIKERYRGELIEDLLYENGIEGGVLK